MWMPRGEYVVIGIQKWNYFVIVAAVQYLDFIFRRIIHIILVATKRKLL